jgi:hypothetical protein
MHPGCTLTQVYLCRHPVDFRKSIDGLSALVEQELELSPFGSALYVLINRQKTSSRRCTGIAMGFACGTSVRRRRSLPGRARGLGLRRA